MFRPARQDQLPQSIMSRVEIRMRQGSYCPLAQAIKQHEETTKVSSEKRFVGMKKYICLLAGMALLAACEQKETTVNPPAEKKESNTTIINQSPAAATTKEKTEVNVNTSPSP